MKIIEGDFSGSTGRIVVDVFRGDVMQIAGQTYKFPTSFGTIKLINKDERRPLGIILLLCCTIIGIPLAILLAIAWKKVTANIGFKLNNGKKFIATCDSGEWKIASKYVGTGSLDKF